MKNNRVNREPQIGFALPFPLRLRNCLMIMLWLVLGGIVGSGIRAQYLTNLSPPNGTTGQQFTLILTGSGTNFTVATGCELRSVNQPNYAVAADIWSPSNATHAVAHFSFPPNAVLGDYQLTSIGYLNPPYRIFHLSQGTNTSYGKVKGKIIVDLNQNCVEDGNDLPLSSRIVSLWPGSIHFSTDAQGHFDEWVPLGVYTLSTAPFNCSSSFCPPNLQQFVSVMTPMTVDSLNDFFHGVSNGSCFGLTTSVSWGPLRPGFTCLLNVFFENNGINGSGITIGEYILNPAFTYLGVTVAPTQQIGDTLRWNLGSLQPGEIRHIQITASLPTTIPLGTLLPIRSRLYQLPQSQGPAPAIGFRFGEVGGSYDPNDKQVFGPDGHSADGPISANTMDLSYLIRFQNTGTDTAFNIIVRDTIDAQLDMSTFEIKASSHPVQAHILESRIVEFLFSNILLVDSFHNERLSHGFVEYAIRRKPNLSIGSVIRNMAHIYFDFNLPVATNRTATLLCQPLSANFGVAANILTYQFQDQSDTSAQSWLWNFGDGQTSTLQHPVHTFDSSGTYEVCLTVTNACYSETYCTAIVTCQTPNPAFSYQISGPVVAFTDLSRGNGWHWDFGDGSTSTVHNPTHYYASGGNPYVCLRVDGECFSDSVCTLIDLCPPLQPSMMYVDSGASVTFTGLADSSTYLWHWDFGDGHQAYSQQATHVYASNGPWTACLTVGNACVTETVCDTLQVLAGDLEASSVLNDLRLFPNPSAGIVQLQLHTPKPEAIGVAVVNDQGVVVWSQQLPTALDHAATIDFGGLSDGIYLVQVMARDATRGVRVVLAR